MTQPILGCIADDLTGATDLANNLVRAGMRVVLVVDVPTGDVPIQADAVVVALKSRSIPAPEAVAQSLQSCRWLRGLGVRQIYFKICSTFDSTPNGNIGPVIEALMDELDCAFSAVVPAFPENNRTVYKGHLFVADLLLSESGMRHHPLNPMTDSNLVRFLGVQLNRAKQRKTGLIDSAHVATSAQAIRERIAALRDAGVSIAIADTLNNDDLRKLAAALCDDPLVTAGSGLALGLPEQWGFRASRASALLPPAQGRRAILSGSCSTATNAQVRHFLDNGGSGFSLDPMQLAKNGDDPIEEALAWSQERWSRKDSEPLLFYSTASPQAVQMAHHSLGVDRSGELVERALASLARNLLSRGVGQLIVAGGEVSGDCIRTLGIDRMRIGPQIDPGVPWCYAAASHLPLGGLHLALKSGNFGSIDFFTNSFLCLDSPAKVAP